MAETESLDLGSSYAKRRDAAFNAVHNGDPCEKVAPKVSKALYGGVRRALKSPPTSPATPTGDRSGSRERPKPMTPPAPRRN